MYSTNIIFYYVPNFLKFSEIYLIFYFANNPKDFLCATPALLLTMAGAHVASHQNDYSLATTDASFTTGGVG